MTHLTKVTSLFNKFADSVRELPLAEISEIGIMFTVEEIKTMLPTLIGRFSVSNNQKVELAAKWLIISAAYQDEKVLEENKIFLARKCTSRANPEEMVSLVNELIENAKEYDLTAGEEFKGPKFSAIELDKNCFAKRDNSQDYNKTSEWANSGRQDNNPFGFSFEEFILVDEYEEDYLVRKNDPTFKDNSPYKEENWFEKPIWDLEELAETNDSSNDASDKQTEDSSYEEDEEEYEEERVTETLPERSKEEAIKQYSTKLLSKHVKKEVGKTVRINASIYKGKILLKPQYSKIEGEKVMEIFALPKNTVLSEEKLYNVLIKEMVWSGKKNAAGCEIIFINVSLVA